MASRHRAAASASEVLSDAVQDALQVAKKARRHKQSLSGDNFYANKMAELRAEGTNAFSELSSRSAGDTSAMAEMMEAVFSPLTGPSERLNAARELMFSLKTTWRRSDASASSGATPEALFPLSVLSQARRGYLVAVCRQMNGCFSAGWYDACAVMMRRLVEISIIEAYEGKCIAHKIRDSKGDYLQLSDLVGAALAESTWTLSRNTKRLLPELRDIGHMSAHGRYYTARKPDIERARQGCRVVVEEFLHHAGLL